jgi:hypothetical protein
MGWPEIDRRNTLLGTAALGVAGVWALTSRAHAQAFKHGSIISVSDFGARSDSGQDDTRAIQQAISAAESSGGGTVLIPGRYRCGNIIVSGRNVRLQGRGGWLVNGRLTIRPEAVNIDVVDLGLVDTRGDPRTFLMDISGRDCRFSNVQLIKEPIAGGYQMYLRQSASGCRFDGLRLKGSNGIMLAGSGHSFENFDLESTMSPVVGADDAFAIKGLEDTSQNIVIRNGVVRGFASIVSFGSEIGTRGPSGPAGAVRNVTVENVTGDRCGGVAFFKPGALIYDWRNGLIEDIVLRHLTLRDTDGEQFRSGIRMIAARGAVIRGVQASGISIVARAKDRHVAPTSAIDLTLLDIGNPARIEDVSLQLVFSDPFAGAPHGRGSPGFPVDHIVRIEKQNPRSGSMSGIVLDVEGRGASFGGIFVGEGLDGAVSVPRAVLTRVATDPPSSAGGGGIWSSSRLNLGDVTVESVKLPKFGGRAFGRAHN